MVSLCVVSMPETAYCCFGLNKLGSVCNIIEPRTNTNRIVDLIKGSKSKVLVIVDVILKKLEDRLEETGVETVIVIPISESMPWLKKTLYKLTKSHGTGKLYDKKNEIVWDEFTMPFFGLTTYHPLSASVIANIIVVNLLSNRFGVV